MKRGNVSFFRLIKDHSGCCILDQLQRLDSTCGKTRQESIKKRNSYRSGITWWWVNIDRIFTFEWGIYIALYCVLLYTQSALQSCGGLSSTTTSVQHPLGWCNGSHRTTAPVLSPHTSYRWRGERVIEPIKWMGIIRRPWLTRASGGNLARTPGLHPYSLRWVSWDF